LRASGQWTVNSGQFLSRAHLNLTHRLGKAKYR
jgi:hypothetical protein